uniref:DNA-directed RNA polymerase subunit beta n=1 Tax=Entransia fimbriata TaxID=130991 RepID=A0A191T4T5_9VIRI|nr:beta subunit of RNA polymerase [Entransia fimbriata]ANI25406.1 beta subunit of RNA polymerase [Entransia fimbriata]
MNYFHYNTSYFQLPSFIVNQIQSFRNFLIKGVKEELYRFPIIENSRKKLTLHFITHETILKMPKHNEHNMIYKGMTYSTKLYVPIILTYKNLKKIKRRRILLGKIPLITSHATFIINGIPRVLVNQIVRSPGIYYRLGDLTEEKICFFRIKYYCEFIPLTGLGTGLKLQIDTKKRIWLQLGMMKDPKINIITLLSFLELKLYTINQILQKNSDFFKLFYRFIAMGKIFFTAEDNTLTTLYEAACLMPNTQIKIYEENIKNENPEVVSWYKRKKINFLYTNLFKKNCYLGKIGRANINRKLKLSIPMNEVFLLPQDFLVALNYLINLTVGIGDLDDIDHLKNRRIRSVGEILQYHLRLGLGKLAELARDNMRKGFKLQKIFSTRPLATTWKDLFGSHPLSQFMDQINALSEITHKRRISCLGPGGLNRDTAHFDVRDIHSSYYGRLCPIETPEGPNTGLISSLANLAQINGHGFLETPFYKKKYFFRDDKPFFLGADKEEELKVSAGDLINIFKQTNLQRKKPIRYQQDFFTTEWNQVDLVGIFPMQYFSIAASLIPFLEHDDANRTLMGSNMQRQAIPLMKPEKPIVGTGLERQVALDSGTIIRARDKGQILYVDCKTIQIKHANLGILEYNLNTYKRSNQDTCIHHNAIVTPGEIINKGQILADNSSTVKGELALGKNILVAYMPWEGYNFEDAILISERLIYDQVYTSIHIEKYETIAYNTYLGPEIITNIIPHLPDHLLKHLDKNGVVKKGVWVQTEEVLVGKLTPCEFGENPSAAERLLMAIYGEDLLTKKETCLKVSPGSQGRIIDTHWLEKEDLELEKNLGVSVYILQKRTIQVGDKVAGRHGNKGIVSKILPREDMPHLQNGTPIDMVLSPLGVPSRMNVGQIFECLLGLAGSFLNTNYRFMAFDERYESEASRKFVFSQLLNAQAKNNNQWIYENDFPGKSKLWDGRTGERFQQAVTVGKAYILKLIHQVEDKIHARATGPYSIVTQQPLRGRSKRGGQRLGEMEVWALEGFGAAYTLQELLTLKSDDIEGRHALTYAIITNRILPQPNTPEAFKVLLWELRALLVDSFLGF